MRSRPRQAVILAGGRGTRLKPLTDTRPKPMIEFHGKPFLGYLIELLREQGFERILLLLGYLPAVIQDYCGTGRRWGVHVDYAVSPVDDDTGRRLKRAAARLDPIFCFLYGDNYWPMPFDRMWQRYCAADAEGLLTIYGNADGYSRDNVRIDAEGWIIQYDKDRRAQGLKGVDIGFGIFRREALDLLPEDNISFERVLYPTLADHRQLLAFVTAHRYYTLSSFDRLPLTERFLARRPAIILDRDGVLNRKPPRAEYIRSWNDWEWLPGAQEALRLLREAGFQVIVVSNQAGIARGAMTEHDVIQIHQRFREDTEVAGGRIDGIYYCPHGWDEGCACRKPKPGMLVQAQRDFQLDLSRTYFIGDDARDGQAAEAACCPWIQVSEERPLLDVTREILRHEAPVQGDAYAGVGDRT